MGTNIVTKNRKITTATTTNLTGYLYGDGSNVRTKGTEDGWIPAGETWAYASADDPTYTFTVAADVTTKYSAGMRLKLTQSTVKYFIITAVSTYSGGNTTITVYGGTDYDLADAAISSNYYSVVKAPQGFPLTPVKWSVQTEDTSSRTQANPTAATWYNLGSVALAIPIGVWDVFYKVQAYGYKVSIGSQDLRVTLSTANNSESDATWTTGGYSAYDAATTKTYDLGTSRYMSDILTLTSKATYYLNTKMAAGGATSLIANEGAQSPTLIRATCSYL